MENNNAEYKPVNPFVENEIRQAKAEEPKLEELLDQVDQTLIEKPSNTDADLLSKDTWTDLTEPKDELADERVVHMAEVLAKLPKEKQEEQLNMLTEEDPEEAKKVEQALEDLQKAA